MAYNQDRNERDATGKLTSRAMELRRQNEAARHGATPTGTPPSPPRGTWSARPPTETPAAASSPAHKSRYADALGQAMGNVQQRQAPVATAANAPNAAQMIAAQINPQANALRGEQLQDIEALRRAATGAGPSAAELQMRQGLDRGMAAQRSAAASMRGVNPALAQRMTTDNIANLQADVAGQTGVLRAQEQAAARDALAQAMYAARGQDIGLATTQAGLQQQADMANMQANQQAAMLGAGFEQQTALANQQAALMAAGQGDAAMARYLGLGMGGEDAANRLGLGYAQIEAQERMQEKIQQMVGEQQMAALQAQQQYQDDNWWKSLIASGVGGVAQGAGGALAGWALGG